MKVKLAQPRLGRQPIKVEDLQRRVRPSSLLLVEARNQEAMDFRYAILQGLGRSFAQDGYRSPGLCPLFEMNALTKGLAIAASL